MRKKTTELLLMIKQELCIKFGAQNINTTVTCQSNANIAIKTNHDITQ